MQGSQSRFRNVFGETSKEKFDDAHPHDMPTDGSLLDVNEKYIALSWLSTGGGSVAVFESEPFRRLKSNLPLVKGHTAPVLEVKFSPFKSNLLATGSDDATIRIWNLPEEGLKKDLEDSVQIFDSHSKKISIINFSPVASEIIASAGFDNTVYVWNILNGQAYTKTNFTDGIYSLEWNRNGSLLGVSTKEKKLHIIDPRTGAVNLSVNAHETTKNQKMMFLKEDYVSSVGFSRSNERQLKLYDMRKFTESIQVLVCDQQNGIVMPFFDYDTGLIYLPGKGEGNIKFYDFSDASLRYTGIFSSNTGQKGMAMYPKRILNYNKSELARFAKLNPNSIETVSFYFPKRNEGYDASIYPDVLIGEPAVSLDDWLKGVNKEPVTKAIHTIKSGGDKIDDKKKELTFDVKKNLKENVVISSNTSHFEKEIKELKESLADAQRQIERLHLEKEALIDELGEWRKGKKK